MVGILTGMEKYIVKSNRGSGNGRGDIFIRGVSTRRPAMVLELKVADDIDELDEACDAALKQIEDKRYADELWRDGYRTIYKTALLSFANNA